MKKAILDQLFLGFLLLMGIVTFVATVNDETATRNHIYDLKALTKASAQAMARYYEDQIDMCTAQTITTDILNQQKLGIEALDNGVSYKWWDTDGDSEPDQVTATIAAHPFDTFWYRFFDKDAFTIDQISWTEPVNTPVTVTLSFDSEDAGYNNMMGTYQIDNNNCVINAELLLQNSNSSSLSNGDSIGNPFTSPPTYVFLLSEGYDTFNNSGDRPKITDTITVNNHCFDNATSNPSVTLNGITNTDTHMYFEHIELNGDGNYEHIQLIPKNVQTQYESFIGGINANEKYQLFLAECESVNNDNDSTNDIPSTDYEEGVNDCLVDGNNQYLYAMEDIDGGGDQDFNDLMLSSTREVIPNAVNSYTILDDGSISLTCNNNDIPTLSLQCPNSIDENTSTSFGFTVSDSDGTIASTTASSPNGTLSVNSNTITYTPDADFFGDDLITVITIDNEGASKTETCTITVNEINLAPTINGNPQTSIEAGNSYTFTPSASDPDGDTLTFSISGKPSWASFDTSTGQLYGAPDNSNVGIYSSIVISVSDGTNSTSLSSFNIEVTEDTANSAPVCNSIADQDKNENENLYLDLNSICTDDDGDTLTFVVTTDKGLSLDVANGIIDYTIPTGATIYTPLQVTITASDSSDSDSTSFTLNINDTVVCTINESENFSSSDHGWSGGIMHSIGSPDNGYRINGNDNSATKTYTFGSNCANQDVTLNFDYSTRSNWENNEYVELYINGSSTYSNSYSVTGDREIFENKSETIQTNSSGNITIKFKATSSADNERAWFDNIKLSKD